MDEHRIMAWGGGLLLAVMAAVGIGAHLVGIGAEGVPRAAPAPAAPEACAVGGPAHPLPAGLEESSGVAASRRQPGVFWTHNDSGDPVLWAVRADGSLVGRMRLGGAEVVDWEDLATGPCPQGECLFVGDVGDNDAARPHVTVYRVAEPAPGAGGPAPVEAFHGRYPGGPQDAEALFVLPSGQVHVVTKGETGPVGLYRFPEQARPGDTVTLEHVRDLTDDEVRRRERITGAAASADGRWIAVRTLETLSIYPAEGFLRGGAAAARALDLAPLGEPQGEAVDFAPDGTLVLTSEAGPGGGAGTIAQVTCRAP